MPKLFQRVLLVEDEAAHALLTKRALTPIVGSIQHVGTLAAAQELLAREHFDLIVTDLYLPDGSRAQLVETIVASAPTIPLLVLTSSTALADAVEAMKVGARDFIVKNFDKDFQDVLGFALTRIWTAIRLEGERARLEREMSLLRVAIESSDDGLAVVSESGVVHYANQSFRRVLRGLGAEGENVLALCTNKVKKSEELRAVLTTKLLELSDGGVWSSEILLVEDKNRGYDLTISAADQAPGVNEIALRSRVVWIRDISEQRRRENFQRAMLSTTTHDLKGPLGAITLSAELLGGLVKDAPKAAELAMRIRSSAHGAINLVDEFLSARRIQEGNFILRPDRHLVAPLCEDVLDNFLPIAKSKGVTVQQSPIPAGLEIVVDRLGFIRAVGNILSNAIKFTPKGGLVSLSVEPRADEILVRVSDSGTGMEPSEVQKIFGRFERLDRHQNVQGTGLGLFVVKNVVQAHGGKVVVTSTLGRGSTFELSFPNSPPVDERGQVIALDFA